MMVETQRPRPVHFKSAFLLSSEYGPEECRAFAQALSGVLSHPLAFLTRVEQVELEMLTEWSVTPEGIHYLSESGLDNKSTPTPIRVIGKFSQFPASLQWLAIAVLLSYTQRLKIDGKNLSRGRNELMRFLLNQQKALTGPQHDLIIAFESALTTGGDDPPKNGEKIYDFIQYAAGWIRKARPTDLSAPATVKSGSHAQVPKPSVIKSKGSRPIDDESEAELTEIPDDSLALQDSAEVVRTKLSSQDEEDDPYAFEQWLLQKNDLLHLSGSLLPGTERSFSLEEAGAIMSRLADISQDSNQHIQTRLTAISYCLVGLTARPWQICFAAICNLIRLGAKSSWLDWTSFDVDVPGKDQFAAIKPEWREALHDCKTSFDLPISPTVTAILRALTEIVHSPQAESQNQTGGQSALLNPQAEWVEGTKTLVKSMLEKSTRRFSEERLRKAMPISVWLLTGDVVEAQFISGNSLEHSIAHLNYYNFPEGHLQHQYADALRQWCPPMFHVVASSAPELVGAPKSAIRQSHIQGAVAKQIERLVRCFAKKNKSIADAKQQHNLLTIYTASLLGAGTSHRLTYYLRKITASDFVLDIPEGEGGIGVIFDKLTVNGGSMRPVSLCVLVRDQIRIYLESIRRLIAHLEDERDDFQNIVRQLRRAYDGSGPLFLVFDALATEKGVVELRPLTRRDLESGWPEYGLPIDTLRHRFTVNAQRSNVSCDNIRRLKGHSLEYVPYGTCDPESPLSVHLLVAKQMNEALLADGWTVAGKFMLTRMPVHHLHRPSIQDVVAHRKAIGRQIGSQDAKRAKNQALVMSKFEGAIRSHLLEAFKVHLPGISLEPISKNQRIPDDVLQKICRHVADTSDEVPNHSILTLALRQFIEGLIKEHGWESKLPAVRTARQADPVITPATMRAYHLVSHILEWAEPTLAAWESSDHSNPSEIDRYWTALIVVLACRGGLVYLPRLFEVLKSIGASRVLTQEPLRVILDIQDPLIRVGRGSDAAQDDAGPDEVPSNKPSNETCWSAIVLSDICALVALRHAASGPSTDSLILTHLNQAFFSQIPIGYIGSESTTPSEVLSMFLSVAAEARKLSQPGVRWAWETATTPAVTLSSRRYWALKHNVALNWGDSGRPPTQPETTEQRSDAKPADGQTYQYVKGLRRTLYGFNSAQGRRGSRETICAKYDAELNRQLNASVFDMAITHFIKKQLNKETQDGKKAISSTYTNLTAILEPLIHALAGRDIAEMSANELSWVIIEAVKSKSESHQKVTFSVLCWFLESLKLVAGLEPDWDAFDLLDLERPVAHLPYLINEVEFQLILQRIGRWQRETEEAGSRYPDYLAPEFAAGVQLLTCMMRSGPRTEEVQRLHAKDLSPVGLPLGFMIKAPWGDRLKTPGSERPVVLEHSMSKSERTAWSLFVNEKSGEVFSQDLGVPYDKDRIIRIVHAAMRGIVPADSLRCYAARHTCANAAAMAVLKACYPNVAEDINGLLPFSLVKTHPKLPAAIMLHWAARLDGHSVETMMGSYFHFMGVMTWPDLYAVPEPSVISGLAGISYGNLRYRANQSKVSLKEISLSRICSLSLDLNAASIEVHAALDEKAVLSNRPVFKKCDSMNMSHLQLGEAVLDLARGRNWRFAQRLRGLPEKIARQLPAMITSIEKQYGIALTTRDHDVSTTEQGNAFRIRDESVSLQVFKQLDVLEKSHPERFGEAVMLIQNQTAMNGTLCAKNQEERELIVWFLNQFAPSGADLIQIFGESIDVGLPLPRKMKAKEGLHSNDIHRTLLNRIVLIILIRKRCEGV